ncbi:uncharacterized protein LOC126836707 isoform X1 [Adelges cooleyi]|uniref:uncharacterized protein LOC126836707 isoform X1 n=1 Tax=Adelges cooleyi TaxID=133065 RepID=UPI00217FC2C8|nr:uncharacterized protein LOC126836707 isoform X1 [Adelges cooleyi]
MHAKQVFALCLIICFLKQTVSTQTEKQKAIEDKYRKEMDAIDHLRTEKNPEYYSKGMAILEKKVESLQRLKVQDAKDDDNQNKKGKNVMRLDHEPVTDNHPQSEDSSQEEKQEGCMIT